MSIFGISMESLSSHALYKGVCPAEFVSLGFAPALSNFLSRFESYRA